MSVQVRVSYNTDEELRRVVKLLSPMLKSCKTAKEQTGRYRKAYIWLNTEGSPSEPRGGEKIWGNSAGDRKT